MVWPTQPRSKLFQNKSCLSFVICRGLKVNFIAKNKCTQDIAGGHTARRPHHEASSQICSTLQFAKHSSKQTGEAHRFKLQEGWYVNLLGGWDLRFNYKFSWDPVVRTSQAPSRSTEGGKRRWKFSLADTDKTICLSWYFPAVRSNSCWMLRWRLAWISDCSPASPKRS